MLSLFAPSLKNLKVSKPFLVDLSELLRLYDVDTALAQLAFGHERA